MKLTGFAVAAVAAAVSLSAPAYADPDTDFDNQLQKFGIYGPHDYNPYLGKIVCHRLGVGVDRDAAASAHFLSINLDRGTTQVQAYQFLGSAIAQYCPDLQGKLQNIPAR
jgi:TPR repeat protein